MSGQQMEFPETFEKFAEEYGFKDDKEVYTNGIDLIPIFRVKQWLEHDNKLRTIETDTAYECGKHASKWIPVSERLPEDNKEVLVYVNAEPYLAWLNDGEWKTEDFIIEKDFEPIAWMPLPEPYEAESEE